LQSLFRRVYHSTLDGIPALLYHFKEGEKRFERFGDGHVESCAADAKDSRLDVSVFAQIRDRLQEILPHGIHIEHERAGNECVDE